MCRDRRPASPPAHLQTEYACRPAAPHPAAPTPAPRTAPPAVPRQSAAPAHPPSKMLRHQSLAATYCDAEAARPACPPASPARPDRHSDGTTRRLVLAAPMPRPVVLILHRPAAFWRARPAPMHAGSAWRFPRCARRRRHVDPCSRTFRFASSASGSTTTLLPMMPILPRTRPDGSSDSLSRCPPPGCGFLWPPWKAPRIPPRGQPVDHLALPSSPHSPITATLAMCLVPLSGTALPLRRCANTTVVAPATAAPVPSAACGSPRRIRARSSRSASEGHVSGARRSGAQHRIGSKVDQSRVHLAADIAPARPSPHAARAIRPRRRSS